jgi:hypothetical protein
MYSSEDDPEVARKGLALDEAIRRESLPKRFSPAEKDTLRRWW